MTAFTDERPYTQEMVVVHGVFRRESQLLSRIVRAVPAGDRASVSRTASAIGEYVTGLHHHHALEDELIWPLLRERFGDPALTEVMETQHAEIDRGLAGVVAALTAWRIVGGRAEGDALADLLDVHRAQLVQHLDEEEARMLPLVAEHLTVAEWKLLGDRRHKRIPRSRLLLALGAVLEDATAEEQAYFLAKAPAVGRAMWRLFGRRQYAAHQRALRSPLSNVVSERA